MRTIRTPGHGQELLRIFLRKFQHASGLSLPLLEYPSKQAPHLEGYYYVYLRIFLSKHGCQLKLTYVPTPALEREQDLMIMDIACNKPKQVLSNANINKIHYCQSYLQIHQLSDMCTADGNYILDTVFQGEQSINQSTSRTEEIIQERPDSTSWRIWRTFLRPMCYEGSSKLLSNDETQLGRWMSTIHTSSRLWPYYYSVSENTVYRGYREDWHSNEKYQFDAYQGNDAELFDFIPIN